MRRRSALPSIEVLIAAAAMAGLIAPLLPQAAVSAYTGENSLADPAAIEEGRSLFNQNCAHCHGPNAITGQSERDLTRLRMRYGDDMPTVFRATVMRGRLNKGMPPWDGYLDEQVISRIYLYLETVQTKPR